MAYIGCVYLTISVRYVWGRLGLSEESSMYCYNALQMGSWGHGRYCVVIAPDSFAVTEGRRLPSHNGGIRLKNYASRDVSTQVVGSDFFCRFTLYNYDRGLDSRSAVKISLLSALGVSR